MSLIIIIIFVPILVCILLLINALLATHRPDTEKVTPYESGFSGFVHQTRASFSIQYYLVAVLFLLFDLEVLLLYPIAVSLYSVSLYGFVIAVIFFTVLTLGLVYEISSGSLYFTDHRSAITNPEVKKNSN